MAVFGRREAPEPRPIPDVGVPLGTVLDEQRDTGEVFHVSWKNLGRNLILLGDPGAGKTANMVRLGRDIIASNSVDESNFRTGNLAPKVYGDRPKRETLLRELPNRERQRATVVVIDNKGERALLHAFKQFADDAGVPFRQFSVRLGDPTYAFNPIEAFRDANLTRPQFGGIVAGALGTARISSGYGYYASKTVDFFINELYRDFPGLRDFLESDDFASIADLTLRLERVLSQMSQRAENPAEHLFSALRPLSRYPHLNLTDATPDESIDLKRAIKDNEVLYFQLFTRRSKLFSPTVARLVFSSLLEVVAEHQDNDSQTYLFIDEFQNVADLPNIEDILRESRSEKLSNILATQTTENLKGRDFELNDVIQATTATKIWCRVQDEDEIRKIRSLSPEGFIIYEGVIPEDPYRALDFSATQVQQPYEKTHLLTVNEVQEASSEPLQLIAHVAEADLPKKAWRGPQVIRWDYGVEETQWKKWEDKNSRPPDAPLTVHDEQPRVPKAPAKTAKDSERKQRQREREAKKREEDRDTAIEVFTELAREAARRLSREGDAPPSSDEEEGGAGQGERGAPTSPRRETSSGRRGNRRRRQNGASRQTSGNEPQVSAEEALRRARLFPAPGVPVKEVPTPKDGPGKDRLSKLSQALDDHLCLTDPNRDT